MNNSIKLFIGVVISSICLYFTFKNYQFSDLTNALQNADWKWLLIAPFIHILAFVFRTIRWRFLLSPIQSVGYKKLFVIITFGFFVNNILPARMGEFARAYATNRLTGIPTASSFGSIAVERTMDMLGVVFMVLLAFGAMPKDKIPLWPIPVFFFLILSMVGFTFLMEKKAHAIKNKIPLFLTKVFDIIHSITLGFSALKSIKIVLITAFLSLIVWSTEAINLFIISRVFGIDLNFFQAAALIVGLSIGVMIPAAPGYVGTYELFGKKALILLGFPGALSLSFVLVVHFFQLIMNSFLGIPGIIKIGLSKANLTDPSPSAQT